MPLAPVIERELRVASRQPSAYWLRGLAASLFVGVGWLQLSAMELSGRGTGSGWAQLTTVGWLAFAACVVAGPLLASDTLSREKRQGTLGLLFLTDLSPQAVLWGKLTALLVRTSSMALASVPILALSVPFGAVTPGRVAALAAVLLHTLLWSLAISVFFSACCTDGRSSMALSSFVVGAITLWAWRMPELPVGTSPGGPWTLTPLVLPPVGVLLSPLALLRCVLAPGFTLAGALREPAVLLSLGTQLGTTFVALALAGVLLARSWRETRPAGALAPGIIRMPWRPLGARRCRPGRQRAWLERSPWSWLAQRRVWHRRLMQGVFIALPWVALGLGAREDPDLWLVFLWGAQFLLKVLLASEAAHLFVEHRRGGLFELVLTTPLSAREIASAHAGAMRRLVALPVLSLAVAPWIWRGPIDAEPVLPYLIPWLLVLAEIEALIWVAPARALRLKRPHLAWLSALVRVLVLPRLLVLVLMWPVAGIGLAGLWMLSITWFLILLMIILSSREELEQLREAANQGQLEAVE